jgi:molecular chaperone DnaK (HSP70)
MDPFTPGLEVPAVGDLEILEVRLVIAIDYGTTFTGMGVLGPVPTNSTGVAYATPTGRRSQLRETDVITDWGDQMGILDKIPSVYSYSPSTAKGEQQWGLSISEDAIAMVNTKLELDLHDVPEELDIVLHALDGMKNLHFQHIKAAGGLPAFTWKGPEDIITDYLRKVFAYLLQAVAQFSEEFRAQAPVDIVVTVPPVGVVRLYFQGS